MGKTLLSPHAVQQMDATEQPPAMLTSISPVLCAWYEEEQGIHTEGSHGICPDHATTLYASLQARRERRAA